MLSELQGRLKIKFRFNHYIVKKILSLILIINYKIQFSTLINLVIHFNTIN